MKNISHISWNKHYTDHDTNYVAGTVGSAAAVHLLFYLFITGKMTENLLCHLAISKIMPFRSFFFCSVESNHLFSPNYSFSSLPLHHKSLGKKIQPPEQIFFLHSCCFGKIRKKCHPLGKSVKQISYIQFENVHLKVLYLHFCMLI